ncbi:hypothetical protein EJB05_10784, partial [Eragrostis curvula]
MEMASDKWRAKLDRIVLWGAFFVLSSFSLLLAAVSSGFGAASWLTLGVSALVRVNTTTSGAAVLRGYCGDGDLGSMSVEGEWVRNADAERYPLYYQPGQCPFVDAGFRCSENGRPDGEYARWRWHTAKLLEILRNRRLDRSGGTSGSRRCCACSTRPAAVAGNGDDGAVYEENGSPIAKHKGFLSFRFRDHNSTVEYYRSPYLVRRGRRPPHEAVESTLQLDAMDVSRDVAAVEGRINTCRMQPLCFCCSSSLLLLLLLRLSTPSSASASVYETITVDWRGRGDFMTVQSAVNSVPDGNREWIRIHVKSGSYWEKVTIPSRKRCILLEGDGLSTTDISFDAHAHGSIDQIMRSRNVSSNSPTFRSATFTVLADNFVARNIAFKVRTTDTIVHAHKACTDLLIIGRDPNGYGFVPSTPCQHKPRKSKRPNHVDCPNMYNAVERRKADQAVAALVGGDKSAFYGCAFHGFQDTLCDFEGRHYFRRCLVTGVVDFVFGYGQSVYDGCVLASVMPPGPHPQPGWVTAHARDGETSPGGLVFQGGAVVGTTGGGRTYLGRAWNRFATVVFYRTRMGGAVVPQGWQAWNAGRDVSHVTFAEVGCVGPGAEMTGRVGWEKHLSEEEVQRFVDIKFIDDDGWLSKQP